MNSQLCGSSMPSLMDCCKTLIVSCQRLASSCWPGSTGRAFHPQGSDEKFQSCRLHLIPLSHALLGTMKSTDVFLNNFKVVHSMDGGIPLDRALAHLSTSFSCRPRRDDTQTQGK